MRCKTRAIVLHSIPYNDSSYIVHTYTEELGRIACLLTRKKGKHTPLAKALFMPLSVIEIEAERQPKQDLWRIQESRQCFPLSHLTADPVKNALALFLAEVLFRVIRETEPDTRLFAYLSQSIHFLDGAGQGVANFHLVFLLHLLSYLGIFPHTASYQEGSYFDMQSGLFSHQLPPHKHYLNKEESQIFARLFRINYENMSLYTFTRQERVNILQRIISYYRLHLPEIPEIKSLPILQILFD